MTDAHPHGGRRAPRAASWWRRLSSRIALLVTVAAVNVAEHFVLASARKRLFPFGPALWEAAH